MRDIPRPILELALLTFVAASSAASCSLLSPLDFLGNGLELPPGPDAGGSGTSTSSSAGGAGGSAGGAANGGQGAGPPTLVLHKEYTRHLGRWLKRGENVMAPLGFSTAQRAAPFALAEDRIGFFLTDLLPTEAGTGNDYMEAMAFSTSLDPPDRLPLPKLTFYTHDIGGQPRIHPVSIPGIAHGAAMATGAVVVGAKTYLFMSGDFTNLAFTKGAVAHAEDENFKVVTLDFINSSNPQFLGNIPLKVGDDVYVFGTNGKLGGPVYLAKAPAETLGDRTTWQYFAGYEDGGPKYQGEESAALPVLADDCAADIYVARHEALDMYLMLYTCNGAIQARFANTPDSIWSDPVVLLDQAVEAFNIFVHLPASSAGFDDGLSDFNSEGVAGAVYGSYPIAQWFSEPARGLHSIVYTVSTANPFSVSLVETVLAEPGFEAEPPPPPRGIPPTVLTNADFSDPTLTGWTKTGGTGFTVTTEPDNSHWFATTNQGTGRMSQTFQIDGEKSQILFHVRGGGTARVRLLHGPDEVRASRAFDPTNPLPVVWRIDEYRGETVTLEVFDEDTTNRIEVSPITIL